MTVPIITPPSLIITEHCLPVSLQALLSHTLPPYLKLWAEGKEEGLSCAVKSIADFKGL